jgi:hypothetical protein
MRQTHRAAALAILGALLSPLRAAAEDPPHVRVELVAGPELPACDRERHFRSVLNSYLREPLLDPPTTHVLRARFRQLPGGYAIDLSLSGPGGAAAKTEHLEYVGVCCFEAMYLAAKESARMIEGDLPAPDVLPAPVCTACATCAAGPSSSFAMPPSRERSTGATRSQLGTAAGQPRDHTRIELDVGPDLPACLRPRDLRRLVYELAYEELIGPPTTNVLHVKIRRSSRRGFVVDVWLEDEKGNTLGSEHLDYPNICCFEVLFLAAVEGAVMLEAAGQAGQGVVTCPVCPPCPEVPAAPPARASVPRRRPVGRHAANGRPTFLLKGGAFVGAGIAPEPAIRLQAGFGVRIRPQFSVEADLAGTASLPVAGEPETLSGGWTVSGALTPCWWLYSRYGVCGVVRGGGLWPATARQNVEGAAPFGTVGGRGLLDFPLSEPGFTLRVEGELAVAFARPEHNDPRVPIALGRAWTAHLGVLVVRSF